jgi:diguanylate cyclase (GGDEF)-like protein
MRGRRHEHHADLISSLRSDDVVDAGRDTGSAALTRPAARSEFDEGFAGSVLDAIPDATAVVDTTGTIVMVNRAWRMFALDNDGDPGGTGVGMNYFTVCERAVATGCPEATAVIAGLRAVLTGATVQFDNEYSCPSPAVGRWFLLRITPLVGPRGGAVVSHVNISRRKMAEDELAHEASHDPLTGLANRTLFLQRLANSLKPSPGRCREPDAGVLFLDLDGFKPVNDRFGHDAGDEVLLTVAHRLRRVLRDQDTVARLGGDEFAVSVPRTSAEQIIRLVERLDAALAEPYRIHGRQVQVRASIGSHVATAGESPAEALRCADLRMYQIKRTRQRQESHPAGGLPVGPTT